MSRELQSELNKQPVKQRPEMVRIVLDAGDGDSESMWATPVEGGYRLESIPRCAMGYALLDIVKGEEKNGVLVAGKVIMRSGNMTVAFATEPRNPQMEKEVLLALKSRGCVVEDAGPEMPWLVNVPPNTGEALSFLAFVKHEVPNAFVFCLSHGFDFTKVLVRQRARREFEQMNGSPLLH